MTNTAPVATATVNGVVATSAMTPQQIFNSHLVAQGATPIDFKAGARSGPPLHVHADHTGGGIADAQAVAAKAPPSPKALERQNALPTPQAQAAKITDFDAEMVKEGKQIQSRSADGKFAASEIDQKGIDKLNAVYRALPAAERDAKRGQYEAELREFYSGRRSDEKRADFQARQATSTPAAANPGAWSIPEGEFGDRKITEAGKKLQNDLLTEYNALPAKEKTPQTIRAYQVGILKTFANEHGLVATHYFEAKFCSGYRLPAGEYTPEVIHDLARARAIGLSQEQVVRIIESERS